MTTASRSGSLAAPQRKPFALAFRIVDGKGQTVRDFDVEHTKRMHSSSCATDMTGFQHLHPAEKLEQVVDERERLAGTTSLGSASQDRPTDGGALRHVRN